MPVADALNTRVRIADPKPAYCSGCFQGAEETVRFVDFQAAHDSGAFVNEHGAVLEGSDDLYLCENCVRSAAEALALKPQLVSGLYLEIKALERDRDRLWAYVKSLNEALASQQEVLDNRSPVPARRPPGRPRKS